MNNKNIFASNLKRYMELKGKNRREVCADLKLNYFTFSDWVNGKKYPRMDKVELLADYFEISKSDLIEEKTIENDPVGMAERHIEIIMDEDIADIFDDFKKLDKKKRQIVKDLVRNLADADA